MKKLAIFISFLVLLGLTGCATTPTDPAIVFKGQSDKQIFDGAEQALAKKNYSKAVTNFEGLQALYPFGPYSEQGQIEIIYAYYMNQDPASALAAADEYIRLYPRSPKVDYAYYMKGLINFERERSFIQRVFNVNSAWRDLSYMRQAFIDFNELVQRFPESAYAADARTRMIYIRNVAAQYELLVAQYYMNHQAYLAAANRASYVVQHFQGAPQVIDALVLMVKAYRQLNEPVLAAQTLQILSHNYPTAPQMKQL